MYWNVIGQVFDSTTNTIYKYSKTILTYLEWLPNTLSNRQYTYQQSNCSSIAPTNRAGTLRVSRQPTQLQPEPENRTFGGGTLPGLRFFFYFYQCERFGIRNTQSIYLVIYVQQNALIYVVSIATTYSDHGRTAKRSVWSIIGVRACPQPQLCSI